MKASKYLISLIGKRAADKHIAEVNRELAEFTNFIIGGGFVPSGNYCKCCERYDCGCSQAILRDKERDRGAE